MKSWKEMTYEELLIEKARVENLLKTNKNPFTQKQNHKYLKKLSYELDLYERNHNGKK